MLIQSITPCKSGLRPTQRSVSRVSDAPMKKSESVMRFFASLFTAPLNSVPIPAAVSPMSAALLSTYVLNRMATTNHIMKRGTQEYQGFVVPSAAASCLRTKNDVTKTRTTIQNTSVSLMVVATYKALTPC